MLKVLKPGLGRLLAPAGRALARTPITPNMITVIGAIGMTAGALTLFPTGHLFAGTMVCTGFVLSDMLDGVLARLQGSTGTFGAFLDSTLDRVGDAAVFGGVAIWFVSGGHNRVLAAVSLFCLVAGLLVSYARARAEGLGIKADVGIAERTERLLIGLVAIGLSGLGVPYVLPIGLWTVAVLSAITFGQRVYAVRKATTSGGQARGGLAPDGTGSNGTGPEGTESNGTGHNSAAPDTAISDNSISENAVSE